MPPTRRSRTSGGPASKGSQKTLPFANTKSASTLSSKNPKGKVSIPAPVPITVDVGHVSSEAAVTQQAAVEISALKSVKSAEEEQASKVTDTQIKKYWKEREEERRTPRVHQEGLDVEEKILRLFDMSSQFGPAIGIARMKRWVRANKLGLKPPIEVLAVLLKEEEKGNTKIERAHMDELMSSKNVIGEA